MPSEALIKWSHMTVDYRIQVYGRGQTNGRAADLIIVPSQGGQVTPDLIPRMMDKAQERTTAPNTYFTNQLHNADLIKGYEQMGRELLNQVDRPIHAFCGGVGTADMLMGVAHTLKQANSPTRIIALEPAASAVISTGTVGAHHVEGIGLGFIPLFLDRNYYDEARGVDEPAAREMARRLAKEEGIFAGTSTGLNVVGALALAQELGPGHTVVTVSVDTGLKYLAGDLYAA